MGDPYKIPFELGLHQVTPGTYAYLQPDGGWGLSNCGLIVGNGESFLVDTLFDLKHTQAMLDKIAHITDKNPIVGALNTHENGSPRLAESNCRRPLLGKPTSSVVDQDLCDDELLQSFDLCASQRHQSASERTFIQVPIELYGELVQVYVLGEV